MSQNYRKRRRRSSRKPIRQPEGEILGVDEASVQLSLPIAEILAGAHDAVEAVVGQAGAFAFGTPSGQSRVRIARP